MSILRVRVSAALAGGLLLAACSDQKKEIAGPPDLRARLNTQQSAACPTSIDPNDTSCLQSTGPSFSSTAEPGASSNGSLKIAYINDNEDLLGLEAVQKVVTAEVLGTVTRLTIQQVLNGELDSGGYHVIFHARHYGGPSTGDPPTSHPFTRVPAGLRAALDRALEAGVGFITEWQGGSPVWTEIGSDFNYYQMTETNGQLWTWYQGTVDRGDCCGWILDPLSFTRTAGNHPVMQGLAPNFTMSAVEHCYRVQNADPSLEVLATITDATGNVRPAILAGERSNARVVLWPCDWGDNSVAPTLDANLHKWIANAIRWAAEGAGTTKEVPAGEAATVTIEENGKAVAGVDFPQGTFDEDVTVRVRFENLDPGEVCHDYLLGQIGRCLEISVTDANGDPAILHQPATVGLCLPTDLELEIFKFEERRGRAVPLQQTTAAFLNCEGFTASNASPRNRLEGLAMGLMKRVGDWLSPKPLWAADKGFGGSIGIDDHFSFFTWASPMQIAGAALSVNVLNSGKDVYTVWGTFGLEAKAFDPGLGEAGFDPARDVVAVGFGKKLHTIPVGSFKWSSFFKRYVYAAKVEDSGITVMEINPVDGKFLVIGTTKPSEGAGDLATYRAFDLRIGQRARGAGLECGTDKSKYKCVLQH
jgi:hypothetical protein